MYTVKKEFNSENGNWEKDMSFNLLFLRSMQEYATELLRARGHIFLNEVYDMLGLARTANGAVSGWIWNQENDVLNGCVNFEVKQNDEQIELTFYANENILDYFSKD